MAVEYFAFPDRREMVGGAAPLSGEIVGDELDFTASMRSHPWQYPVLLVYREHHDCRWSFRWLIPKGEEEDDEDG